MNNKIAIVASIFIITTLASCQKKESEAFNSNDLVVSIAKPTNEQIFKNGDTVFIKAKGSYISEMHGYSLQIKNSANDDILFEVDEHVHGATVDVDTFWVSSVTANSDLQLNFTLEADHDGHEKSATINFHAQL